MAEHEELVRSRRELLTAVRKRDDEIERLRAALREIANHPAHMQPSTGMSCRNIAREALGDAS